MLPVYQHTFAAKANLLAFEHRVAMCELSFASVAGPTGRVKVKRVEEEVAMLGTADAPVRTTIWSLFWQQTRLSLTSQSTLRRFTGSPYRLLFVR